jgi:16S rRNA (guanine527-N7)-methyltransferase
MSESFDMRPDWLNVSRETFDRLEVFCQIVKKWSPAINLVSKPDIAKLWQRHLLDSAQIFYHIPLTAKTLCDLGSGGGFPGIVLGIMASEARPDLSLTLIESDRRKSVFLSEASRLLSLNVKILPGRIDELSPQHADVISARALAPLATLCGFAQRHMTHTGTAIFPKGRAAGQEILDAEASFRFHLTTAISVIDAEACILSLKDIQNV